MREAGVIRLLREEWLEQGPRGQQVLVALVSGWRILRERQRVEDRGLSILGVRLGHPRHCLLVRDGAGTLIPRLEVLEQFRRRREVVPLTWRFRAGGEALLDGRACLPQCLGRSVHAERIAEVCKR